MSGYISKPNLKELANTVPFKKAGMGSGNIIYFTDNTNFRAFWYGTNKLLMYAIFFGDWMLRCLIKAGIADKTYVLFLGLSLFLNL